MSKRRDLINELRAYRAGLIEQKEIIDGELEGTEAALEALNGKPAIKTAKVQRKVKYKAPDGLRRQQMLDYLREHPEQQFSPIELANSAALPRGSVSNLWQKLVDNGDVVQVGKGYKGVPIIKHKPTTIKPGYEVIT